MIAYYLMTGSKVDIGEIIYMLLGTEYTQDEKIRSLHGILSNSNFSKDPSKVTEIELTVPMIAVNNQKDSGPKASGALSKKIKQPKSKKTPTEVQVTPPSRTTEDSQQSHSVSSGNVPDPQDPKRNKQLADPGENVQPADKGLPSTISDEGTVKTMPLPEGPHRDKDSEGFKLPADMKPLTTPVTDPTLVLTTIVDVQALLLSDDELMEESEDEDTESDSDSSCPEALKKYDNVLPLTERQLVQYLQKVSRVLYNRLIEDQWEKHEESAASYADLKSKIEGFHDAAYKVHKGTKAAFSTYEKLIVKFQAQYGKDAEKILGSLKRLKSLVESLQASALRQDEHLAEWAKSSTSMA
ncbi:hypothetical protein Tco_0337360 [Tanacetum coccineum]